MINNEHIKQLTLSQMEIMTIIELNSLLSGILNIKYELDNFVRKADISIQLAKELSAKYYTLLSNINQCLHTINNIVKTCKRDVKFHYSDVINKAVGSESAKRRIADNDSNYLNLSDVLQNAELLKLYIVNLKDEIYDAHKYTKMVYQKEVELFLGTPNQ